MKHNRLISRVLIAFVIGLFAVGCGKKTDEALLTEFNAKKTEAEKLIADATEGLKKLGDEHASWMASVSATKALDSTAAAMLTEKLRMHESMIAPVQAGVDSLKFYVAAKTTTDDEIKTATAGLNAHLAAVDANWKALWEAHTKAGAEVTAALSAAAPTTATEGTTTTTTNTTTTTTTSSEKHETAKKTPGGTPKVPPAQTPVDQDKHETAKQTPGGTPKTTPAGGATKK